MQVCVFSGSSPGANPAYQRAAEVLGKTIGNDGHTLIYGGGDVGLMAVVADAALAAGADVVGVITEDLVQREVAHRGLTELIVLPSMHERKMAMFERSDAVVALPGGLGTLDELFEILTWAQLGIHQMPCGLLNVAGYYDRLLEFLDHTVDARFMSAANRSLLMNESEPSALLARFGDYVPIATEKWLDRD